MTNGVGTQQKPKSCKSKEGRRPLKRSTPLTVATDWLGKTRTENRAQTPAFTRLSLMSPRASKGKRRRGKKIGEVGTQAQGQAFQRGYLIKGSQDLGHLAWRVLFKGSIQLYTLAKLMTKKKIHQMRSKGDVIVQQKCGLYFKPHRVTMALPQI